MAVTRSLRQKRSFLGGKLGKPVASKLVTLVDDPLLVGGFGSRPFTCSSVSRTVSPSNGARPVNSAYRTAPRPWTSVATVTAPLRPVVCSGAMYVGVPSRAPVCVRLPSASTRLARPKSVT